MFSMGVIMLIWALFWYPFYYFVFPENLSTQINNLIAISREYLRMLPAILFLFIIEILLKLISKKCFRLNSITNGF